MANSFSPEPSRRAFSVEPPVAFTVMLAPVTWLMMVQTALPKL